MCLTADAGGSCRVTSRISPLAVFLLGVVLYFIGFNDHGSRDNVLALLLRASMSSIEMFVSESDLIEVKHGLHNYI